jgi:hypothetical protein
MKAATASFFFTLLQETNTIALDISLQYLPFFTLSAPSSLASIKTKRTVHVFPSFVRMKRKETRREKGRE